jgi:hypothetical protein
MVSSSRTPPRFVPTLTTVVEIPPELPVEPPAVAVPQMPQASQAPAASPAEPAGSGLRVEDFNFGAIASTPRAPAAPAARAAAAAAMQMSEEDAFRLEEQLLHRVLQRVDFSLEERLTDTVSAAVQRQLDVMLPKLRSEIEAVLRALVVEALAQELSETPGSTPP